MKNITIKKIGTQKFEGVASMRLNFENAIEIKLVSGELLYLNVDHIVHLGNGSTTVIIECNDSTAYGIVFEDNDIYGDWMLTFNYLFDVRSLAYIKQ